MTTKFDFKGMTKVGLFEFSRAILDSATKEDRELTADEKTLFEDASAEIDRRHLAKTT